MISRENNPEAYISPKEFKLLLDNCSTAEEDLIVNFLWFSVRRINEFIHVKVKDVDSARNLFRVTILKRRKKAIEEVQFFGDLLQTVIAFIDHKKLKPNDYLLTGRTSKEACMKEIMLECDGDHLGSRQVRNILKRLCVRSFGAKEFRGLTLHPHRFRKSFGFNIAREEIKKVGKLGDVKWDSIKLVQRATRDKDIRNAVKYFDVLLDKELDSGIEAEFEK